MSSFIVPPRNGGRNYTKNAVYTIGEQLEVKWNTSRKEWQLTLWQQNPRNKKKAVSGFVEYAKEPDDPATGIYTFDWTINKQNFNLSVSPIFFFAIGNVTSSLDGAFLSHYFNLTEPSSDFPSSSTLSSISSIFSSASTINTKSISQSATTLPFQETSSLVGPTGTGSAQAAQSTTETQSDFVTLGIGLGVGLGLGIPILLAIGSFIFWRYRKRDRRREKILGNGKHTDSYLSRPSASESEIPMTSSTAQLYGHSEFEMQQQRPPPPPAPFEKEGTNVAELSESKAAVELPAR